MDLSFKDLRKRDVINLSDGACLGRITNLVLSFPKGVLTGIVVPGRKGFRLFRIFDKNEIFIDEKKIVKIGSDVILVNLKCGDVCGDNTEVGTSPQKNRGRPQPPYSKPCPPPCSPNGTPNNCPPTCEQLFNIDTDGRMDLDDY